MVIFTYLTSFFLAVDYTNITVLLELESLSVLVPSLMVYYVIVLVYFQYNKRISKST